MTSRSQRRQDLHLCGIRPKPRALGKGNGPKPINWKAGLQYDGDVARAKEALANLAKYYPEATGYEVTWLLLVAR